MEHRGSHAAGGAQVSPPEPRLRTRQVAAWGIVAWGLALLVIALVPALHTGERQWWIWVPVAGVAVGLLGYGHLRRLEPRQTRP